MNQSNTFLRDLVTELTWGAVNAVGRDGVPMNVRLGDPNRPGTGRSLLGDEEEEVARVEQDENALPRAATILAINDDGLVLAVSRRNDRHDFGLPGGKVDAGETPENAARRELAEETGLEAGDLALVFEADDNDGYHVTTFATRVSGEIDTEETGVVKWVTPEVLMAGCFGDYNEKLFMKVGML